MNWLIITLVSTMGFALTSVLDNVYVNRIFRGHLFSSIFYGHLLKALIVFMAFAMFVRSLFPLDLLPFFVLIAGTEIAYLLLYFKSLQNTDTSIVAALFSLGRVFVPFLAFLTIGEVLTTAQYVGFCMIILSSVLLTLNRTTERFTFNVSLFYMGIAAVLLAIQAICYKFIFATVAWPIGYSWAFLFIGLATLALLLFQKQRNTILADYTHFKRKYQIVVGNVLLSLLAWAGFTYALSLTDVSLVKGIEASEPFFVMLYAILFKKQFPDLFKEETDGKSVYKKALLFVLLIIGIGFIAA